MKAKIIFALALLGISACSTIDQREPKSTSTYVGKQNVAANLEDKSSESVKQERIELFGNEIPAGTMLRFVLTKPVSSATAKIGDQFELRSRTSVALNGIEVLPLNLSANIEVIHTDRRGMLGKPGELLLKFRTMQWRDREIKLRNSVANIAKDKTNTAMAVSMAFGLAGLFVSGNDVEIPTDAIILGELVEPISQDELLPEDKP